MWAFDHLFKYTQGELMKAKYLLVASIVALISLPEPVAAEGHSRFCERGNRTKKITIRSANGLLCLLKPIAEWAEANCSGVEDYEKSMCHKTALKTLGKNPKPSKGKSLEDIATELESSGSLSKQEKVLLQKIIDSEN